MPDDPSDDLPDERSDTFEQTAEFVADELEGVAGELEHVGRQVLDVLRADLISREGYLIVLIMVLLTIVEIAIADAITDGQVLTALMVGLLVLTTLSRSHVSHLLRMVGVVVTGSALVLSVVGAVTGNVRAGMTHPHPEWLFALGAASYTLVLALCFPAILRQAFTHQRVTLNTVAAALSAYLLLGLIFASAFRCLQIIAPPFFIQSHVNGFTYIYFSYITLTTVGYGDFTPANDAGRAAAILEGLFGQVFLVTIVALVVSNLGRVRQPVAVARRRQGTTDTGGSVEGTTAPGQ